MTAAATAISPLIMLPGRRARVVSAILGDVGFAMAALATMLVTRASITRPGVATTLFELATAGGSRSVEPRIGVLPSPLPFRLTSGAERQAIVTKHASDALVAASDLVAGTPREAGITYLLLADWDKAIDALSRAGAGSARELSAAFYMRGRATDSLNDFATAIQTLSVVPDSAEVTFNRALILEQLCDREAAAEEWRKYLALDASSAWAGEARQHLAANTTRSQAQAWQNDRIRLLAAAATHPARPELREWVRRYPLAARRLVETDLLPKWGKATLAGDRVHAARLLTSAGNLAAALQKLNGDQLLGDAVEEIRGAANGGDLAIGWSAYGEASVALDHYEGPTALALLDCGGVAARENPAFAAVIAPPLVTALYYSHRSDEAEALVEQMRERYRDRDTAYIGFFARLDWSAGVMRVARTDPGEAIRLYQRALAAYDRLGEAEFQAAQHINLAVAYRYLGQEERSSAHLLKALRFGVQAEDLRRLHSILNVAAEQTGSDIGPAAALAFHDRLIRLDSARGQKELIADALVTRSVLLRRAGRFSEAQRDLDEAQCLADAMAEPSLRQGALAVINVAEAFIYRDRDDQRVIDCLSRAIDLYSRLGQRSFLAQLLLERGRAHSRRHELVQAESDYRRGVAELEHQRSAVGDSADRITYFDRAEELFVDLSENALRGGRPEEAFDWLEKGRARELLDRTSGQPMQPMSAAELRAHLPADVALVTHTVTASNLITCVLTRRGVQVFEESVGESRLTELVNAIDAAFVDSKDLPKPELRALARHLVAKVRVAPETQLVFIPDRFLYRVPFAALPQDDGSYLVEAHVLSVAPSATLFVRNAQRAGTLKHPASILLLASPQIPAGFELPPLRNARREATRIAKFYAKSRVLDGADPNATSMLSIAPAYDVLHYGGHTLIDRSAPERSCLFVGEHGHISLADIEHAQLSHVGLVVLGGCNTGVGRSHRSEGVLSLARAFMAASVPAVVGTVAPVGDADSAAVLTQFHLAYASGENPAAALRSAQLQMLRRHGPARTDPARWSAFQVVGGAYGAAAPKREETTHAQQ